MTFKFDVDLTDNQKAQALRMDPAWRHHFHFRNYYTGGLWDERHMDFITSHLPPMKGMKVLDIGFCDGYYSFYAEAQGARQVVGVDRYYRPAAKFVAEVLDSECQFMEEFVEEWDDNGKFGVVLCLGVFYHVPDIVQLLRVCAEKTNVGGVALFEGPVMGGRLNRLVRLPQWARLADPPLAQPNHHFWMPTESTLRALLGHVGFEVLDTRYMWSRILVTARRVDSV